MGQQFNAEYMTEIKAEMKVELKDELIQHDTEDIKAVATAEDIECHEIGATRHE